MLKSPFRAVDGEHMHKILAQENEVLKIAKLTDTDKLQFLEAAVTRLSVQATLYSQSLSEEKYDKILAWLSPSPYYSHHRFVSESRLPGFGKWLFRHEDYIDWQISSSPSLLLLHGITGSGKSTFCSIVVDSLFSTMDSDTDSALLAYFYCANPELERSRRASEDVMRTILGQLALDTKHRKKVKDLLYSEYERQAATASVDKLDLPRLTTSDCVRLILELAELDPLTIVVDAVDSVEENERHLLMGALKEIISKADNVVKILVTSRSNNRTAIASAADKQIQITSHQTQQDMEAFVNQLIDSAIESKLLLEGRVSPNLRSTLLQGLFDGAGEM